MTKLGMALETAIKWYHGQIRKFSRDPYIIHPIRVAY